MSHVFPFELAILTSIRCRVWVVLLRWGAGDLEDVVVSILLSSLKL